MGETYLHSSLLFLFFISLRLFESDELNHPLPLARESNLIETRPPNFLFFLIILDAGPRRRLSLELSDTKVYGPYIRAHLGTAMCLKLTSAQVDGIVG